MKDRVREAVFNLLGPAVVGKHAIDLFAGTGALGLEAVSRGAVGATFIEQHVPTANLVQRNVEALGAQPICELVVGDVFFWWKREPTLPSVPWVVFCSPPYALYAQRLEDMLWLLGGMIGRAPAESMVVVEADESFDFHRLPLASQWDVRRYPPARIGILSVPRPG